MASFAIGGEDPTLSLSSCKHGTADWEEIACTLLDGGFVLTALELYTELLECGQEVSQLRSYFSNPGNFEHAVPHVISGPTSSQIDRTPSMSTFDSIEMGRGWDEDSIKDADDRVPEISSVLGHEIHFVHNVLEFELRKAHETIKSLKSSLTEATEIGPPKMDGEKSLRTRVKDNEPINPLEKRALNFLVHEYLIQHDNKLTSITFSEENADQDFDDWDDVHLDIAKPPDLLHLFRDYHNYTLTDQAKVEKIRQLEKELSVQNGKLLTLKRENEQLSLRLKKTGVDLEEPTSIKKQMSLKSSDVTNQPSLDPKRSEQSGSNHSSPDLVAALENEAPSRVPRKPEHHRNLSDGGSGLRAFPIVPRDIAVREPLVIVRPDLTGEHDDADTVVGEEEDKRASREVTSSPESTVDPKRQPKDTGVIPEEDEEIMKRLTMSTTFRQELLNSIRLDSESHVGVEVAKLSDPNVDVIQLLGTNLPLICEHFDVKKKEELIPMLVCVVAKHPDSKVREVLLNNLFNLVKKPNKLQRHMIMSGCVAIAKVMNQQQMMSELLPQLWTQISDKLIERRLLVAESCGLLAPYIPSELRGSLMLSMLKQMMEDEKADSVRQTVMKSLGILVAFTDDEDKFNECWQVMLKALNDSTVVSTAHLVLLPAVTAWATELNQLESKILDYFLHQMEVCIKQVSRSEGETGKSLQHIGTLTHLVPWHLALILLTGPYGDGANVDTKQLKPDSLPSPECPLLDIKVILGDEGRYLTLMHLFKKELTSESFKPWKSVLWFTNEYLKKVVMAAALITKCGSSQSELIHSLSELISRYCKYFGHAFTHKVIEPVFKTSLQVPEKNAGDLVSNGNTNLTTAVLPVYVAGVLATFPQDEKILINYIRTLVLDMASYFATLDSVIAAITELKRNKHNHDHLLSILQELAANSSLQVRRYAAILFGTMVQNVDEGLIDKVVLPQLVKLARDTEMFVKVDTIESFGSIIEAATTKDLISRARKQFETFMDEDQFKMEHPVQLKLLQTMAKIGPHADPEFRDEFIIPRLKRTAAETTSVANATKRSDLAMALLDAYSNISECFISYELLRDHMMPGLKQLHSIMESVDKTKIDAVQKLITSCNTKLDDYKKQGESTGTATPTQTTKSQSGKSIHFPTMTADSMKELFKKKSTS